MSCDTSATLGYETFLGIPRGAMQGGGQRLSYDQRQFPTINEYSSMLEGREFAEHELKLKELQANSSLWPEGAEAPSSVAILWAREVLSKLTDSQLMPTKLVASVEGGVACCFVSGEKYADIECLNSGALLGVTTNRLDRPFVWEIDPSSGGIIQACERISKFLKPQPPGKNDSRWAWFRR